MLATQMDLSDAKTEINDIEGCLLYSKYFMSNLADLWATSDHNLKQQFQTLIFPEKIYYKNKIFRTTATALIFKYLHSKNRLESFWYPQGDLNPCLMAENHVSWAWLDDGGVDYVSLNVEI